MTVTTFAQWDADGRPHKPARPVAALVKCLTGYGYTVYTLGNDDHAKAKACNTCAEGSGAEDHMPYSHTPWPGKQPYPFILADDIMPPPAGKKLPTLSQLAGQMFKDRQANFPGISWLKYMNWEPIGGSGPCYHDAWQPNHTRVSSTDRGHIHQSCRTDFVNSAVGDDYDPVARFRGDDMADSPGAVAAQYRLHGLIQLRPVIDNHAGTKDEKLPLVSLLTTMAANVAAIAGKDFVDEDAVVAGVLKGFGVLDAADAATALKAVLTPEQVAALAAALVA